MKLDEALGRSDEMRPQRAVEARELITDLGVTFIKIAQVWASRHWRVCDGGRGVRAGLGN